MTQTFEDVKLWAFELVKRNAPYRKGDLLRSFQLIVLEDGWIIQTTIPYMVYTEMKWTYNKRWGKTLQNKNEKWFRNTATIIAEEFARRMGGVINVYIE